MKMKNYYCRICARRGNQFGGTRKEICAHFRDYHGIKNYIKDKKKQSRITEETIVIEDIQDAI